MAQDDREPLGREAPFPPEMQGHWVEESDPNSELIVTGSEMNWFGIQRDYQDKTFTVYEDGTVCVTLEFDYRIDSGDDLELAALPNGSMYAYNVHSVCLFVRTKA